MLKKYKLVFEFLGLTIPPCLAFLLGALQEL